ncbi:hypothetical protein PG985_014723 [Apiospora marii]|uniref:uncharacterized protein n=1 Tax=Apiospora marii TaxID=335849 RepID=UPI00312E1839
MQRRLRSLAPRLPTHSPATRATGTNREGATAKGPRFGSKVAGDTCDRSSEARLESVSADTIEWRGNASACRASSSAGISAGNSTGADEAAGISYNRFSAAAPPSISARACWSPCSSVLVAIPGAPPSPSSAVESWAVGGASSVVSLVGKAAPRALARFFCRARHHSRPPTRSNTTKIVPHTVPAMMPARRDLSADSSVGSGLPVAVLVGDGAEVEVGSNGPPPEVKGGATVATTLAAPFSSDTEVVTIGPGGSWGSGLMGWSSRMWSGGCHTTELSVMLPVEAVEARVSDGGLDCGGTSLAPDVPHEEDIPKAAPRQIIPRQGDGPALDQVFPVDFEEAVGGG